MQKHEDYKKLLTALSLFTVFSKTWHVTSTRIDPDPF